MANETTSAWAGAVTGRHLAPPYYADFMISRLYGHLYNRQLGTLITIPRGRGSKVRISRWQSPVVSVGGTMQVTSTSAVGFLTEGTSPTNVALSSESITGEVTAWGGSRGYTDKLVIVSMADFLEGALDSLSRELAFKIDRYIRAKISGTAFTVYGVSPAGAKPTANKVPGTNVLFGKNVARIKPLMAANGCPTWDDGTYVGTAHDLAQYDMMVDSSASGFISTARYNNARQIFRGEIGEFYGVRWLLSNASNQRIYGAAGNTATFGLSPAVTGSNAFIFSPDAFYNLELETGGVEVVHQPLGSAGTADQLAQRGSIGVKVHFGVLPGPNPGGGVTTNRRLMRFVHATSLGY